MSCTDMTYTWIALVVCILICLGLIFWTYGLPAVQVMVKKYRERRAKATASRKVAQGEYLDAPMEFRV